VSISAVAGTDQYANAFPAGIMSALPLLMVDQSAPSAPTAGSALYSSSGQLHYIGTDGTDRQAGVLFAGRATDSAQNKTTTLTNDDTLHLALLNGITYAILIKLVYSGSVTGGFKYQLTGTAAAGNLGAIRDNAGGGSFGYVTPNTADTVTIGTLNAVYSLTITGYITGGSGNLITVQYAEIATDATNGTFLRKGSWIEARKIG